MSMAARPEGNTDAWFIVHRMNAWARYHRLNAIHGRVRPEALRAARARYAFYEGAGPVHTTSGVEVVAWNREAGRRGYENRSWRSHFSSPTPALPQYNDSDAKRKGES